MPPIVQLTCVDGLGPTIRRYLASASLALSRAMPGWSTAVLVSGSTDTSSWQYLVQSITTASLQHWPARLVPPPRDSTGTPARRQTATAATAASTVRGTTTPMGTCR
jgi:hypothetical protein